MKSISQADEKRPHHLKSTQYKIFQFVKNNRILPTKYWGIYEIIFKYGPCSLGDIAYHYKKYARHHISFCLKELERMEMIQQIWKEHNSNNAYCPSKWTLTTRKVPKQGDRPGRCFWINVYDDRMEVFKDLEESEYLVKEGFKERIFVQEKRPSKNT